MVLKRLSPASCATSEAASAEPERERAARPRAPPTIALLALSFMLSSWRSAGPPIWNPTHPSTGTKRSAMVLKRLSPASCATSDAAAAWPARRRDDAEDAIAALTARGATTWRGMKLIMKVKYEMLCVAFTDGHKREERVRFRHATARREGGGARIPEEAGDFGHEFLRR